MKCLSAFTENFPKEIIPCGFKVILADKRNIILIYANNQIRSLLFDDIAASVSGNLPCQKFYDHEIEGRAGIRTIANSSRNTFGLLEDGRIFYFKSFRAIEVIPSLKNVRAICESPYGFAMIRNSSPEEIFIEFYADHEMLKKYKKIAIGWDEKWSFERDQERSVLQLVRLECDRLQQLFFHFIDVEAEEEDPEKDHGGYSKAVVFSINCSLFCVFYENAKGVQTGVNSIRTFLADVQDIRVFPSGVMCVLLTSGVIHLLYADNEGELRDDSVFLGMDEIDAVESIVEDNCMYLSDRTQCVKVTLIMSEQDLKWTVDKIAVFGVVGISYLPSIRSVLLLTENNFIYAIDHNMKCREKTTSTVAESLAVLQGDLTALTTTNVKMQAETCKSTAINVLLNPQVISDNCKVILSFKSYVDFDELPSLRDQVEDQMYDITLEFQFEPALAKILSSDWRLEVLLRGGGGLQCHKETVLLDDRFLKKPKVKLFRNISRNSERLGSDFEVAIQGLIDSAEKLLIDVPLKVAYNLESLLEVLEEDPFELNGKWSFKIHSEDRTLLDRLLDMIISQRILLEPFVIGIGRSAIVVTLDEVSCTFKSDDQLALQLLKKILLLEAHGRGIWTTISYEPKETIAVREF